MLEPMIDPQHRYKVYLDIKDTRSERKRAKLQEVLRNANYDYDGTIIDRVQQIGRTNRKSCKWSISRRRDRLSPSQAAGRSAGNDWAIEPSEAGESSDAFNRRSRKSLERSTWLRESKLNLLCWQPREDQSMNCDNDWLPPLKRLEDYDGNWDRYIDAVFAESSIATSSRRNQSSRASGFGFGDPTCKGKEAGFWHCVSEGSDEEERIPDLRRCERIAWVRSLIEHAGAPGVDVWVARKGRDNRVQSGIASLSGSPR